MTITRHGRRSWRVEDDDGSLVCVTAYLKGAREVVRRLSAPRELLALAAHVARHPLTMDGREAGSDELTEGKGGG